MGVSGRYAGDDESQLHRSWHTTSGGQHRLLAYTGVTVKSVPQEFGPLYNRMGVSGRYAGNDEITVSLLQVNCIGAGHRA